MRLLACLLVLLLVATRGGQAAEPRRVLLLQSFGREFEPFRTFSESFRTELAQQSAEPLDFFEAALPTARFGEGVREDPFVDYVLALFADRRPDLVVPIGGPAVRFAQRHQEKLFATTPMLIAAVDRRHVQPTTLTTNDAVVAVGLEPTGLLANILQVLPATTNIAMVFGDSPLERFWVKEFLRESERFTNRTRFTWVNGFPFDQIRQRVARLGPHFPR